VAVDKGGISAERLSQYIQVTWNTAHLMLNKLKDLRTLVELTKVLGQTIDPRKHDKIELLIKSEREVAAQLNSTPKEMGFSPRVSFLARLPIGRRVSEKDLSKSYILYSESRSEGGVEGRVSINIRNTDPLITRLEKLTQFNKVLNKYSNKTL
jgi:hypothetical protein